jgi:PIN domain nuclease of toxin-antitoxin system
MIQLDTHVLVWRELLPEKLSSAARLAIQDAALADEMVAISPVTLWEIAMLTRRNRIVLNVSIEKFLASIEERYRVIPINTHIVIQASELKDPFPKDPMDRFITATAIVEDLTLITADRSILASKACKLLW